MLDQLSKNITRCGLSNSTLNYLRVRLFLFDPWFKPSWRELTSYFYSFTFPEAMCDFGADAGVDVQTQDLQLKPQRLSEDLSFSKVAKDGSTSR